ncbi:hypothetical protein [Leifsonia poae]|uniref:Uncharacterized protein n=1 Tax=Leifsonia poae TaxID=110933 RepID=A0A9W6H7G9_9MICO|nr:hypothetical protein [Leifsonia poae]GLJ75349.1 hypothetical protein GCM10017584_09230 [Leifsonia poae]
MAGVGATIGWVEAVHLGDIAWRASLMDVVGELQQDYDVRFAERGEPVGVLVVAYRAADHQLVVNGRKVAEWVLGYPLGSLEAVVLVACDRCAPDLSIGPVRQLLAAQVPAQVPLTSAYRANTVPELGYSLKQLLATYVRQKDLSGRSVAKKEHLTIRGDDL